MACHLKDSPLLLVMLAIPSFLKACRSILWSILTSGTFLSDDLIVQNLDPCCSYLTPLTSHSLYIGRIAVQDLSHTAASDHLLSLYFAGTQQQETASNGRNNGGTARSDPSAAPPASDRRPPRASPGQRRRPARLGRRVRRHHPRHHATRRRGRRSGVPPHRRVLRLRARRVPSDAGACRRPVPHSGKGRRGRRHGNQPLLVRPWVVKPN